MPRSFLVKKQVENGELNHEVDMSQSECNSTEVQFQDVSGHDVCHTEVNAKLMNHKTEISNIKLSSEKSLEMANEMGAHMTWLCENPTRDGRVVSFFNVFTSIQEEGKSNPVSLVKPPGIFRAEFGLDNEVPDQIPDPMQYSSEALWEADTETLIASTPSPWLGYYDNYLSTNADTPSGRPNEGTFGLSSREVPVYSFNDRYCRKKCFLPHGNSSISRSEKSQLPLWSNEAKASSTGYQFPDANYQNTEYRVSEIPHVDNSPTPSPAGRNVLLYNQKEMEGSAFKPYVRSSDRIIDHQYMLNEAVCDAPSRYGKFSYEKMASHYSVRAVPNDSDVSNTWFSIQHKAYTKSTLPGAIAPNAEQAPSTSCYTSHDAQHSLSTQKDGLATESQNETLEPETQQPKPVKANKRYPCDVCGRSFSRSSTLTTHRRIHSGEKPFVCQLCGRAFRQPGNLSRHRLTHTTAKPYVCVHCNKAFNRASNLHTHMRTHTDYKPFACEFCGKRFHQKVDMKIHRYTHTGEKPHKCQKCGRGFKQLTHLTYHMRTHSEERMYHCPYCGKGFNQKGNMQAHIYRHTGERPFKCDTCGKGFTLASTLNTHKRTHAAQKPFQCEFCEKAFYQRNGLKTHYIASHPFSAGISLL